MEGASIDAQAITHLLRQFASGLPLRLNGFLRDSLELLVEFAAGAGNKDASGNVAFAVLHALHDPCGLAALGTVGALGGVHDLLAVRRFGDFCHDDAFS
jgi:hypothetical protein